MPPHQHQIGVFHQQGNPGVLPTYRLYTVLPGHCSLTVGGHGERIIQDPATSMAKHRENALLLRRAYAVSALRRTLSLYAPVRSSTNAYLPTPLESIRHYKSNWLAALREQVVGFPCTSWISALDGKFPLRGIISELEDSRVKKNKVG